MGRPKKDAKYLNVYLSRQVYEDFAKFCEEFGQSKSLATERAINLYMEEMRKKNSTGKGTDANE